MSDLNESRPAPAVGDAATPASPTVSASHRSAVRAPVRILVVDDGEELLIYLKQLLQRAGYEVATALTGQQGLELARTLRPDLVLLDVVLPDISGFEVCRQLKADPRLADCSVVMISGLALRLEDKQRGTEAGADDYLLKPFKSGELLWRLQSHVRLQQAHKALRAAQTRWQALVHSAPSLILTLAPDGRIEFVNRPLPGSTVEQMIGRSVLDFTPPDQHAVLRESLARVASTGVATACEVPGLGANGDLAWYACQVAPLEPAEPAGPLVVIATDITEQKRLAEQIQALNQSLERQVAQRGEQARESQARYRALVEGLPSTVHYLAALDEVGSMEYISPQCQALFGFTPEEWQANPALWANQIHAEDRARVLADYVRSAAAGEPFVAEYRVWTRAGQLCWVRDEAVLLSGPGGQPAYYQGMVWDITVRKQAEEALRRSEEKYRTLLERLPDVAWMADAAGNVLFVSPNIERLIGFSAAEVAAGGPELWYARVHADDRQRARAAFADFFAERAGYDLEYRFQHKDGRWLWLYDRATATFVDGGVRYSSGVLSDVTTRKEAEEARRLSEARHHALRRALPDTMFLLSREGVILDYHAAEPEELLAPPEQFRGTHLAEVLPGEVAEVLARAGTEALCTGAMQLHEYPLEVHGQRRHFEARTVPCESDQVLVIVRDVTARQHAEAALRSQARQAGLRAQLAHLLSSGAPTLPVLLQHCAEALAQRLNVPIARIWAYDAAAQVLRLQASAGEPRAPNDAVEHVPLGRFLVGWIAQHRAPCLTNDLLHDARFEHRAWAARELLVAACGLPLVVEQRLVGVIAVFSRQPLSGDTLGDLTSIADLIAQGIERKRAELVLQESENRYRELFHSNPHPMWVYDRETLAFLDVNEAALRHYGYTREEFLRMTIRDIRPAEDVPRLLAYLETTADECREAGTWQHRLKDGGVIDVEIRSNAIRFAGRRAEVVLALDVTERRRAEAALRELPQRILEAQEAERRRVARDLHDSVCQLLSSVRFRLQGLEGKLAALDAGPLEELAQISGYIGKALDETRRISRNLRPSELDELGLAAALRLLAGDFAEHTGITCELACPELPATLEQGIELALYRIVQEALNNVEKHAQASRVAVDVSLRPGQLTACVRDDGRGFLLGAGNGTESAGAARPGGFGLVSMRERAALIGGTVRLVSAPGRGTEVRADIPLSERSEAGRAKAKGQGRRGT